MKRIHLTLCVLILSTVSLARISLTDEERKLLEQDGRVDIKKHPNPKALRREYFETVDDPEERADKEKPSKPRTKSKVRHLGLAKEADTSETERSQEASAVSKTSPQAEKPKKKKVPVSQRFDNGADLLARRIASGDTKTALAEAEALKEKHPDAALRLSEHLWNGWVRPLLFEGDDKQAFDYLEVLLALDQRDVQAHEAIGALFWRAGKDKLAISHYRQALKLDPTKEYLRKRLRRLGYRGAP